MYHDQDTFDFSQGHVTKNQPMAVPACLVERKFRKIITMYTMMAKTICESSELYYPIIHFLIKAIANTGIKGKVYFYIEPDEAIVLK